MSLADTRTDIATAIEAGCDDWRCVDYIPDQINPPVIIVDFTVGGPLTFGATGDVPHEYGFTAKAFVNRDSERAGQLKLDKLRDPTDATSLWQVLEDSDVGDYARVTSASDTLLSDVAGASYLLINFEIEVVL